VAISDERRASEQHSLLIQITSRTEMNAKITPFVNQTTKSRIDKCQQDLVFVGSG